MSEVIRIVHIIYRLDIGGMENGLVNLVNGMNSRFVHHIISLTDATEFRQRIINPDVKVSELHKKPGKDFGCYWRLWRLLRSSRADIVHTRNFGTVDCGLIARLAGISTLVHSEHGWDMSDLSGGNPRYIRLRRLMAPLARRWLAVSADIRNWLEHTVGVSARKLTHIYNGVDADRFRPDFSASHDSLHAGYVGRLEAVKNPQSLIRAMTKLTAEDCQARPVRLTVVGSGSLLESLREKVKAAGLNNVIDFCGPRSDIPELMRSFDVFVLPSFNEGISNTILEAMASGLPVVASMVGGNPELVDDGITGKLYASDNDQALAECLKFYANNEALRIEHSKAARQKIEENFTLEVMVKAYEHFYLQCLKLEYGT